MNGTITDVETGAACRVKNIRIYWIIMMAQDTSFIIKRAN